MSQGMQELLEQTENESREMRCKYVALGDRVAEAMRRRPTSPQCRALAPPAAAHLHPTFLKVNRLPMFLPG